MKGKHLLRIVAILVGAISMLFIHAELGVLDVMHQQVVRFSIPILLCAFLGSILFHPAYVRAQWASVVILLLSIIGISSGVFKLAWHLGWLIFSKNLNWRIGRLLATVDGVQIGFLLSLIFSGQLPGKRRPPNTALEPTPHSRRGLASEVSDKRESQVRGGSAFGR